MFFNNPIELVVDGKMQEFESLRDFYLKVLQLLYHNFPKGHIDYMVFLHEYTMLRGSPLGKCCRDIERGWDESEGFCIKVQWTSKVQTRDTLINLLRKMTRYTSGAFFDLRQFDAAWSIFSQSIQ